VQIVGSFGYNTGGSTAAPAAIRQACLMLAHRLWRRKDAIFGVAGTPGLGVTTVQAQIHQDTDILTLLEAYERRVI
jgi:hypothetical protein